MFNNRQLLVLLIVAVFVCSTAALAASVLSFPERSVAGKHTDVVIPITLETADGLTAADIAFEYDPNIAQPVAVHRTPYTAQSELVYDLSRRGLVVFSLASSRPLTGCGELAWVSFRIVGEPEMGTRLSWREFDLDGGRLTPIVLDGYLEVTPRSESVVSLPDDARGAAGEMIVVPLSVVPADGILGMDVTVQFDDTVIQITDVTATPITQNAFLTTNYSNPGILYISLFSISPPLAGSGSIADIHFNVVGSAGQSTPLDITFAQVNEGAITATLDDGMFTVCSDADVDGDSYSGCQGDCDDDDNRRFPGNPEICDNVDNDCDDLVDNGIVPASTTCGVGECLGNAGELVCIAGDEVNTCDPFVGAMPEGCDGLDNNCDGSTDEDFTDTDSDGTADCVDEDDDEDGVDDLADCAPLDPTVWISPTEVSDLVLAGAELTSLSWENQGPGARYDVVTGLLSSLTIDQGAENGQCLENDVASASTTDEQPNPPVGSGIYYLVRAENVCGSGTYGDSTGGGGRTLLEDCP